MKNRRLAALACLIGLAALEFVLPTIFPAIVGLVLVVALSITWTARRELLNLSKDMPDNELLKRDLQNAEATAIASAAAASVGIYAILRVLKLTPQVQDLFLIGLAFALIMISAPAVNWYLYWHGKGADSPDGSEYDERQ